MTCAELAKLPVGSIVRMNLDEYGIEEGEIIRSGTEVWIMWPETGCTQVIDTNSIGWEKYTAWLETE